jgi:type I restriction enzyme S subunit
MSQSRYDAYKDSGVAWLGQVPAHWEVKRIGFVYSERREKVSDKDFAALSVTKNGIVPQLETAAKTDDGDNRKKVVAGDFVINSRSDRKGSAGVSSFTGSVSLICTVLKPQISVCNEYSNMLLRSIPFQEEFYRNGQGIVADLWTTNFSNMKEILIPLPPLAEQQAIAAFLDRECARIDALVAAQQRMIALSKEKRQALIAHVVTQGLDPAAPRKDSGVAWLGQVPAHWEVKRVKYVINMKSGDAIDSENITDEGKFPVYGGNGLRGYTAKFNHSGTKVLVGRQGALCGNINYAHKEFWATEHAIVVEIPDSANYLYLGETLRVMNLNQYSTAAAQPGISVDQILKLFIPLPPLAEQQAIAAFLDRECARIDALIGKAEQAIVLLRERRSALIAAAVTGLIRVGNEK